MGDPISVDVYEPEVEQIIRQLMQWHADCIQKLQIIVQASADAELVLRDPDGHQATLLGDERKGFKAGIATALNLIGKFPLTITPIVGDDLDEEE